MMELDLRKERFYYMDLFSGIGGFRQGLELANTNFQCVLSCEIDEKARETYSTLYNLDKQYNYYDENKFIEDKELFYKDINQLAELSKDLLNQVICPSLDMICGGFPCQPFSRSGKRRSFNDINKGNLFFSILEIINKTKPTDILLENVKGILTVGENVIVSDENAIGYNIRKEEIDKGRTFLDIIHMLTKEGYFIEWQVLNSNKVVPQNRERVFIHGNSKGKKIFPIIINSNQNDSYKEFVREVRSRNQSQIMSYKNNLLKKYKVIYEEGKLELVELHTKTIFEFGKITPFLNWGQAFIIGDDLYIITAKLDDYISDVSLKMEKYLETDYQKVNKYNLNHNQIMKQIWSKSSKVVSSGNKMGNMNFPDSVFKPSRTLTATGTLGREIMIVGYFIEDGNIRYIQPLDSREDILFIYKKNRDETESKKLIAKFKAFSDLKIRISTKKNIKVKVSSFVNGKLEEYELDYCLDDKYKNIENRLFFRTLTTEEYWRLQGFLPLDTTFRSYYKNHKKDVDNFDDLKDIVGEVQLKKQAGNAVTVDLISVLGKEMYNVELLDELYKE